MFSCKGRADGFYEHPLLCNQVYFSCWEGVIREHDCGSGLVFDVTRTKCDVPTNVPSCPTPPPANPRKTTETWDKLTGGDSSHHVRVKSRTSDWLKLRTQNFWNLISQSNGQQSSRKMSQNLGWSLLFQLRPLEWVKTVLCFHTARCSETYLFFEKLWAQKYSPIRKNKLLPIGWDMRLKGKIWHAKFLINWFSASWENKV